MHRKDRTSTSSSSQSSMDILRRQLTKMAEEYQKIKDKNKVLKSAVKDEKRRNGELVNELQSCKKELRAQTAEVDSQGFHVQRLTKRVDKLKEQLETAQNEAKEKASNGGWMGSLWQSSAATSVPTGVEEKFQVLRAELQLQIQENERVHIRMFEMENNHKTEIGSVQKEIDALKNECAGVRKELSEAQNLCRQTADEKAHQESVAKRKIQELVNELAKARKEMMSRETAMITSNQQLSSELQEMQNRYARKVNFDDTHDSTSNALNLPPFNRDVMARKCRLLDAMIAPLHSVKDHVGFLLDVISMEVCDGVQLVDEESTKPSEHVVEKWSSFVDEVVSLRGILQKASKNPQLPQNNMCLSLLADATTVICGVLSSVVDGARSSVHEELLVTIREVLQALKVGHTTLANALDHGTVCIPFYCDWSLDFLLMRAPTFTKCLWEHCGQLLAKLEHVSDDHRKAIERGATELRGVFERILAALEQYGTIRVSSSTNDEEDMSGGSGALVSDDSHYDPIVVPAMDVDVVRLRSFYDRSHKYINRLNSGDRDKSVPYSVAVRMNSQLERMQVEVTKMRAQHEEDSKQVDVLQRECNRLREDLHKIELRSKDDQQALGVLSAEYRAHVSSLEVELQNHKRLYESNNANGGTVDGAMVVDTVSGASDNHEENNAALVGSVVAASSPIASFNGGVDGIKSSPLSVTRQMSSPFHPRGAESVGSIDDTNALCAVGTNSFKVLGTSEMCVNADGGLQWVPCVDRSLNSWSRDTSGRFRHDNDSAKYKLLRRQVKVADARAVKFHGELQSLDRVLSVVFKEHLRAKEDARMAREFSEKLTTDMETTKDNYERMMRDLTEHVCQLTEKIAAQDSRRRRKH